MSDIKADLITAPDESNLDGEWVVSSPVVIEGFDMLESFLTKFGEVDEFFNINQAIKAFILDPD